MVARCSCTHRTRHCPLWTFCFPFSKKMDFLFGSHGYFLFACCLLYELSEAVAFNHGSRQGYHRLLHCHGLMGGAYCDHRFFLGARNQPIFRVVLVLVPVTSTVSSWHYAVQLHALASQTLTLILTESLCRELLAEPVIILSSLICFQISIILLLVVPIRPSPWITTDNKTLED
jgi:hypothetical protein